MQNNEQPDKAAIQAGIITHWTDSEGQPQTVSSQTQQQLVALMAQTLPDYPHATHHTKRPLPRVLVFREGHNITLALTGDLQYYWTLTTTGNENSIISHPYQGQVKAPLPLILPPSLLTGYYRLVLRDQHQQWDCTIIITPQRCYEPQALIAGKKLWGACIQLYTLRSGHNWGIGDFGDLAQVIKQLGRQGAAFVGLNPLHALYPAHPERASPYSPSSRRWLNIIYIDINAIDEFQRSNSAQQ